MPEGEPKELHAYLPIAVASSPASPGQERIAIALVLGIAAATAAVAPFAQVPLARIDAFLPATQTTLSAADLVTAALLMAQYLIQPQRGLLALGCGYKCSGLFVFLQTLAFPGAYTPLGLIGDGFNSPPWFFVLWHTTFPLGILVYALLKDSKGDATLPGCSPKQTLCATERRKLPKSQLKKRSEIIAEKFPQGRRAHKAGRAGGRGIRSAAREIKSPDCCKHDVS